MKARIPVVVALLVGVGLTLVIATADHGHTSQIVESATQGVTATLRHAVDGTIERVRCRYLAGCDGGASQVRACLSIRLSGSARLMQRFMTHFRSDRRDLLQR